MMHTPSFPQPQHQISEETSDPAELMQQVRSSHEQLAEQHLMQLSVEQRKRLLSKVFAEDLKTLVHQQTESGHSKGLAAGQAAAETQVRERIADLQQQQRDMKELMERLDISKLTLHESTMEQLYSWAVKACYQVLLYELQEPALLTRQLQTLIKETIAERELILEVSPAQCDLLRPTLLQHPNIGKILPCEALKSWEFRIRLGRGEILSSLPDRLEQLHQLVMQQIHQLSAVTGGQK